MKVLETNAAPVNGTNEVQTFTLSALGAGTHRFSFRGKSGVLTLTGDEANNAAISAKVTTLLEGLRTIGAGNVSVSTTGSGARAIAVTFQARLGKEALPQMTAVKLTGTPTIVVATTTPGVTATFRGSKKGQLLARLDNGSLYINTGTPAAPTWAALAFAV